MSGSAEVNARATKWWPRAWAGRGTHRRWGGGSLPVPAPLLASPGRTPGVEPTGRYRQPRPTAARRGWRSAAARPRVCPAPPGPAPLPSRQLPVPPERQQPGRAGPQGALRGGGRVSSRPTPPVAGAEGKAAGSSPRLGGGRGRGAAPGKRGRWGLEGGGGSGAPRLSAPRLGPGSVRFLRRLRGRRPGLRGRSVGRSVCATSIRRTPQNFAVPQRQSYRSSESLAR